ncbi:MAG: CHAT domain-containing protein [Candidatus Thiodiazotropha sp. (ex. Lucinoma kazani)]
MFDSILRPEMWVTLQLNIAVNYIDRIGGERATNIEEAIRRSEAVLKVVSHKDIPSMWWVRAKDRLGTAYMDRVEGNHAENIETAIVCLSEALDAAVSEESVAGILNRIGLAYRRRARGNWAKNTETAIKYFQQSLEINTLEKNPVEWAHVTSNLALAYAERVEGNEKDNLEDAIHAHESVFCVCTKEKAPFDWARVHSNLAIACGRRKTGQRENNAWAAIEHCKQSLTVYTLDTYPARHRETQANLAELYMELDLWEEAHEAFEAAIRAGETLLYTAFTPSGRTAEAGTTSRIYPHDAYCLARMGREAESLLRLEQGKTRLMAEQLSLATVDMNRVSEQEKTRFEELREKVRMLEAELRLDPATPARSDDPTLIEEIRKARSKLHEKIASIRARNPDFMPEGLDLAALLSLVPRGGAIVAPFVSKRGSAVLIVLDGCHEITSKEIIWLDDFTEVDLESLVLGASGWARLGGWLEAYRRQGDDPAAWRREIQHVTGELWLRLWEPVHMELRKRGLTVGAPLVIMAQGLLAVLPLHAAWRESEGRKRYLLDEYTVSYTPSGFVLRESQRLACEIGRQQISLLAVTNPTKDLAFASLEGSIIGGHFEESKRALLIEGEATMANTLEMMHGRSYLHFASHARFGWENTLRSGLLLAGDEVLSLAKVLSEFDLRSARLVCLSACETGLHDAWKSPGEYVGLPGGFMQAGAPAVISSLWPVTDLSTLLLMDHFYVSHLERQLPLATALRQAQLWLRDLTNAEIADLLNGYLNRLQIADADVRRLVSINYRKHAMDDPDERPFLNPYYWAPFLLSGH